MFKTSFSIRSSRMGLELLSLPSAILLEMVVLTIATEIEVQVRWLRGGRRRMRGRKVGCKLRCSAIEADSNFSVSLKIAGLGRIVGAKIVSELVRLYLSAMLSQKQHRLHAMVEHWESYLAILQDSLCLTTSTRQLGPDLLLLCKQSLQPPSDSRGLSCGPKLR